MRGFIFLENYLIGIDNKPELAHLFIIVVDPNSLQTVFPVM